MQGLAPKTLTVFNRVSTLKAIQGFLLVGGTGIALCRINSISTQIKKRYDCKKTFSLESGKRGTWIHPPKSKIYNKCRGNRLIFSGKNKYVVK